MFYKMFFQLVL